MLIYSLPSSRKDGKATEVDTVCSYYADHMGPGLATEQLYLELSNLTHGVTKLGPYTLDQDSLYVNGGRERERATETETETERDRERPRKLIK